VKAHIGVEILVRLFSARIQTIIDLCTNAVSLLLVALIAWRMAIYGQTMKASGEVSMNLEFPEYIIIYIVAFCFLVFLFQIFQDIIKCFKQDAGNDLWYPHYTDDTYSQSLGGSDPLML
jgi:TRAP-type C4-dicarboxylate transport system permease small subunit